MAKLFSRKVYGQSGREYVFDVFPTTERFNPIGAVYAFLAVPYPRFPDATFLYIGKANDLSRRLGEHQENGGKWNEAVRLGMNAVAAFAVGSEPHRTAFEGDLIQGLCPVLNDLGNPMAEILKAMLPRQNALSIEPLGAFRRK